MNVRYFSPVKDYEEISAWWSGHGWPTIPLEYLPETGLLVENETQKICAGWIYRTDSAFCILEWVVANPKAEKELRSTSLDMLLKKLVEKAKDMDFGVIYTNTGNKHFVERLKKQNFNVTDENVTTLIRRF